MKDFLRKILRGFFAWLYEGKFIDPRLNDFQVVEARRVLTLDQIAVGHTESLIMGTKIALRNEFMDQVLSSGLVEIEEFENPKDMSKVVRMKVGLFKPF